MEVMREEDTLSVSNTDISGELYPAHKSLNAYEKECFWKCSYGTILS